ncbi:type II secretion system F family protein [Alkaliphilus hydrothermalis]|uniref:Type IV pilus assembly protein PilC n=1 Tax=Alkaliphilus hydrothermalis TaxID=1482730 RepID=A0ABS2NM06_9FIRM|nr:type II secretion system F family protein [Alkaliphilus hydrothermalis]MBM7613980.1 type IV pilus assembly protein PilC [Alkaliphilus hydrothermalis]
MPIYQYKAITKQGEKIQGTFQANNKGEVISMLRQNEYYPLEININRNDGNLLRYSFLKRISSRDLAIFCRQFYTMLHAGVPIVNSLDVLKQQTENKTLKRVLDDVFGNIQRGITFSDALRSHRRVVPELLINMIEAGEMSGNLDGIFERMAKHYEKETKIGNKIRGAMVYPAILTVVSILVIIFLLTFVMPTFISMFEGSDTVLPLPTRVLLTISHTMTHYWYFYLISFLLLGYGFHKLMEQEMIRKKVDGWKLKIPVVRKTVQKVVTSRFTRTLSTLLYSGIPLIQALESASRVVGNKVVEEGIKVAIDDISKGASLAHPVKRMGVFPPMLISMIQVGEESGALDEILDKTADFYDDETETALQKMTTLLEPLMIVVMALVIGFIVVSMILPMFDMLKTV